MSARPTGPDPRPEVPVNASWFDNRWRLEARTADHWVSYTAVPPIVGECGRSAVRLGEYLAIHIELWTDDDPPRPLAHTEWHDVSELIAKFEGERPR